MFKKAMLMALVALALSPGSAAQAGGEASTPAINTSCQTDSDCTVKDVGNCCGYYPACVNASAVTDPESVRRQCEKDGMASVCGFEDISACQCRESVCVPAGQAAAQ